MDMTIGQLARHSGLAASALRYYERAGLLPRPARQSGQRRYPQGAAGRVRMIQLARAAGFTIAETRLFLAGFSETVRPAARWRALARRKLEELVIQQERMARMKALLESSFHCGCLSIEECERAFSGAPAARPRSC